MAKMFYNIDYWSAYSTGFIRVKLEEYGGTLVSDLGELGLLCFIDEAKVPGLREALANSGYFPYKGIRENVFWNSDLEDSKRRLKLT